MKSPSQLLLLLLVLGASMASAKTFRRQDSLNNKNFWAAMACDHTVGDHVWNFPPRDPSIPRTETAKQYCLVEPYIQSRLICYREVIEDDHGYNTQVRKMILQTCDGVLTKADMDEWLINGTKWMQESHNETEILFRPVPFDKEHFEEEYEEIKEQYQALDYATYYGVALLAYWALIFACGVFFNVAQKAFFSLYKQVKGHTFRKYVSLPALFGYRHSQPLGWDPIKMVTPTRVQSLVVLGYLILAFVLCFPSYKFDDDYEHHGTWGEQLERFLADRTGIMSFTQAPIVFLFAGRNNFLMWLTGWSFDTFNVYHRWTSRIMMVYAIIHSAIWTWMCRHSLARDAADLYWILGTVATIAGSLMLLQAMQFFRSRWYETFLVLHIVFGILFVVGLWYHCWTIGWMQWVWATIAVWAFDRILRVAKIAYSGLVCTGDFTLVDRDQMIIKAEMDYSKLWNIYPGCHVYIYFLSGNKFWESHPFTVYQSPYAAQNGKMTLLLKAKTGLTMDLVTRCAAAGGQKKMKCLIEGPYGSSHPVGKYDSSIYIAGGIGITATYSYAQNVVANSTSKNIIFTWVVRTDSCLSWFKDELNFLLADNRVRVNLFVTQPGGDKGCELVSNDSKEVQKLESASVSSLTEHENLSVSYGRPDLYQLLPEYLAESAGATAVVVCGPPMMNDDIRRSLCENLSSKSDRVDYFEESFSW